MSRAGARHTAPAEKLLLQRILPGCASEPVLQLRVAVAGGKFPGHSQFSWCCRERNRRQKFSTDDREERLLTLARPHLRRERAAPGDTGGATERDTIGDCRAGLPIPLSPGLLCTGN